MSLRYTFLCPSGARTVDEDSVLVEVLTTETYQTNPATIRDGKIVSLLRIKQLQLLCMQTVDQPVWEKVISNSDLQYGTPCS